MKLQNIERNISIEESDYVLYITCRGVGDTVYKCLDEIQDLVSYQLHQNPNLKMYESLKLGTILTTPPKKLVKKVSLIKIWFINIREFISDLQT